MSNDAWSSDPRFSKPKSEQEFTGLTVTAAKSAGFIAGIEADVGTETGSPSPPTSAEVSYSQQQVDELVAAARADGLAAGEATADQRFTQMQTEHKALVDGEFAEFMGALKRDLEISQPLFKPVRDLALALAEHLARKELSQSAAAIDAVVAAVIDDLDPTELGDIEIHVSESWAKRLQAQPLQGLTGSYPVIGDEHLYDGDVRLIVNNAQVEDFIAQRVQQLAQQLEHADIADTFATETETETKTETKTETEAETEAENVEDAEFEELPHSLANDEAQD